jgi:hypothetical protein
MKAHRVVRRRGCYIFSRQSAQDGGKLVNLMRQPPFTPERLLVLISVRGWVDPRVIYSGAGRIRSIWKSSDLIWNRTRNLPACSTVPVTIIIQDVLNFALFRRTYYLSLYHQLILQFAYELPKKINKKVYGLNSFHLRTTLGPRSLVCTPLINCQHPWL